MRLFGRGRVVAGRGYSGAFATGGWGGLAREHGLKIDHFKIIDAPHSEAAAARGVELIRESKGELLMKGSLHTDELMRAVTSSQDRPAHRALD